MPSAMLTAAVIDAIARPATGYAEWTDTKVPGLSIRIFASGKKPWSIRYRPLGSSAKKRFPLGDYPDVTVSEARKRAAAVRDRSRGGADPAAEREAVREKRRQDETTPTLTFDALVDLYLPELAKRKSSWDQDRGYLARDARPQWGARRPETITKAECAARLLEVAQRAPVSANRLRAALLSLFGWAVDKGLLATSPMIGIPKPTRERKEAVDRTLSDAELLVLWRAIEAATLAPGIRAALLALALTGQRPNEIAGLQISELRNIDDPAEARAEISKERMKARRKHVLPISGPVAEIIATQIDRQIEEARIEGRAVGDHIFTSRFADRDRIARHSLSQALRRIIPALDPTGEDGEIVRRLQADPPTPHAFRRTCVSGMSRLGVRREDIKAVVAHSESDVLSGHYDSYDRLREKRTALAMWARHVERLLSGAQKTGAVVVPIRAAQA